MIAAICWNISKWGVAHGEISVFVSEGRLMERNEPKRWNLYGVEREDDLYG